MRVLWYQTNFRQQKLCNLNQHLLQVYCFYSVVQKSYQAGSFHQTVWCQKYWQSWTRWVESCLGSSYACGDRGLLTNRAHESPTIPHGLSQDREKNMYSVHTSISIQCISPTQIVIILVINRMLYIPYTNSCLQQMILQIVAFMKWD